MVPMDTDAAESRLEAELKLAFEAHRADLVPGSRMCWDETLGFLLMPLLAAYEQVCIISYVLPS